MRNYIMIFLILIPLILTLGLINWFQNQIQIKVNGVLKLPNNSWIIDSNSNTLNNQRIYFDNNAKTYFRSCGTSTSPLLDGFIFRNGAGTDILNINGNGTIVGNGTALTNLNYDAIINKPTLTSQRTTTGTSIFIILVMLE